VFVTINHLRPSLDMSLPE